MNGALHFDYTTVGHVTVDVLADGSRRVGGSAFYSALQAARLGKSVLIVTQGNRRELERLLDRHRHEFELHVLPAASTTTLLTRGSGAARSQRVLAWAGAIASLGELAIDTDILHVAPVAHEIPTHEWVGACEAAAFVGLTPQGLARAWSMPGGSIELVRVDASAEQLAHHCHALVLSEHEREVCAGVIEHSRAAGAIVAITAGAAPTTLLLPSSDDERAREPRQRPQQFQQTRPLRVEVPTVEQPLDDLGAGDVFAAAFFVALREGRAPRQAAEFANAAAVLRMRGVGADAIAARAEIEQRLPTRTAHADARA